VEVVGVSRYYEEPLFAYSQKRGDLFGVFGEKGELSSGVKAAATIRVCLLWFLVNY
jgi:hypothetical protein